MELLNRYLQAVKFFLPKNQKDDIIAELSEDIRAQIADAEEERGRTLTDQELEAILKRVGNPLVVGSSYGPKAYLIGPILFPIYLFVLKMVGLYYLLPSWLLLLALVTFSPGYRAANGGLSSGFHTWSTMAFSMIGMITLGFAVAERIEAKNHFLDNWTLDKLPPVRDTHRIPKGTSVSEVISSLIAALYWVTVTHPPVLHDKQGAVILWNPGPVWETAHGTFFWPILIFTLLGAIQGGINMLQPHWTRSRLALRGLLHLAGVGMLSYISWAHWPEVSAQFRSAAKSGAKLPDAQLFEIWTNIGVFTGLAIALFIIAIMFLSDLVRVVWWRETGLGEFADIPGRGAEAS